MFKISLVRINLYRKNFFWIEFGKYFKSSTANIRFYGITGNRNTRATIWCGLQVQRTSQSKDIGNRMFLIWRPLPMISQWKFSKSMVYDFIQLQQAHTLPSSNNRIPEIRKQVHISAEPPIEAERR